MRRRDYARRPDQLSSVASSKLMNVMIESRLQTLGLTLPAPAALPSGVEIPFAWVRPTATGLSFPVTAPSTLTARQPGHLARSPPK